MSPSHRCATPPNFADMAQKFEICMCKLVSSLSYSFPKLFLSIFTPFMRMFRDCLAIFLRKVLTNKNYDGAKKIHSFLMSLILYEYIFKTLYLLIPKSSRDL